MVDDRDEAERPIVPCGGTGGTRRVELVERGLAVVMAWSGELDCDASREQRWGWGARRRRRRAACGEDGSG
jgi:hypothetical protein